MQHCTKKLFLKIQENFIAKNGTSIIHQIKHIFCVLLLLKYMYVYIHQAAKNHYKQMY